MPVPCPIQCCQGELGTQQAGCVSSSPPAHLHIEGHGLEVSVEAEYQGIVAKRSLIRLPFSLSKTSGQEQGGSWFCLCFDKRLEEETNPSR